LKFLIRTSSSRKRDAPPLKLLQYVGGLASNPKNKQ
jgi:hypothetical protein